MTVPSISSDETNGWMGQFPQLRAWIGPRIVNSPEAHRFKIINREFESTVSVKRSHIMDDKLGVFKPTLSEMRHLARNPPEEMIFKLLASGFATFCYDGQHFFDTDHQILDEAGKSTSVSNIQAGSSPAWFLLDTSRAARRIVWQERKDYAFETLDQSSDPNVFFNNEYIYGVRARERGIGLWQLGFGSKGSLDSKAMPLRAPQ